MSAETKEEEPTVKLEEDVKKFSTAEEKLKFALAKMKEALADEKHLNFKLFWQARHLSLQLFKEDLPSTVRAGLWNSFVELSKEAKGLKALIDEQASFAIEQLELAVAGLQKDVENYSGFLKQATDTSLPAKSLLLDRKRKEYLEIQNELSLLNAFAGKIHSLRKEVLKTEMRVKFKSRFFKDLSGIGDKIFPRRKQLIKEISGKFLSDVEYFIQHYFPENGQFKAPYYVLKEEIKKLQNVSKVFTLNTKTFTKIRLKLSECWDKIKALEADYKKQMDQKKEVFEQNRQRVLEKIKVFENKCSSADITEQTMQKDEVEILKFMRSVELSPKDVRALKDGLKKAKLPVLEKQSEKELKAKQAAEEKNKIRNTEINDLREKIEQTVKNGSRKNSSELASVNQEFLKQMKQMRLTKIEKQQLEKPLKSLKDMISDKKDQALFNLSREKLDSLADLKASLEKSEKRRSEIKEQLEVLRQTAGRCDLDFEKAMSCREQIEQEKARLENIDSIIEQIEEKIVQIKNDEG